MWKRNELRLLPRASNFGGMRRIELFLLLSVVLHYLATVATSEIPSNSSTAFPTLSSTLSPSSSPTFLLSVSPTMSPTPFPTVSTTLPPTAYPTRQLDSNSVGYFYTTVYHGVTCENTVGNEEFAIRQTGMSFGNCIVGYNSTGHPVSSAAYTSDCTVIDNQFKITFTKYKDTECVDVLTVTDVSESSVCQTIGNFSSLPICVPLADSPPYRSFPGGFTTGFASTRSDCEAEIPTSYFWVSVGDCALEGDSPPVNDDIFQRYGTIKTSCRSDTSTAVDYFHDYSCESAVSSVITSFDQCMQVFDATATHFLPAYNNYKYGDCPGAKSSDSDDDYISMSSTVYAGSISGALIGGVLFGSALTLAVAMVCFRCGRISKPKEGLNEALVQR